MFFQQTMGSNVLSSSTNDFIYFKLKSNLSLCHFSEGIRILCQDGGENARTILDDHKNSNCVTNSILTIWREIKRKNKTRQTGSRNGKEKNTKHEKSISFILLIT